MPQESLHNETLSAEQCRPTGLDLALGEQALKITWADGVQSTFPLVLLRRNCPCAGCRTEREEQSRNLLHILKAAPPGEIHVTGGSMVGNYAIQLEWSDGHNSGIFDFKFLRSLHEQGKS